MAIEKADTKVSEPKQKKHILPSKDIKNITIFRELKKSANSTSINKNSKLSKGQKRRSLLKSKIMFRKKL